LRHRLASGRLLTGTTELWQPAALERQIDAALSAFWRERAQEAAPAEALHRHVREQEEYLAAIRPEGC